MAVTIAEKGIDPGPRQDLSPLAGGGRMKDWHSISMRRKKIFIAIVILLVLGLGVMTEYHRRTRDIEYDILMDFTFSTVYGHNSFPDFCLSERGGVAYFVICDPTRNQSFTIPVDRDTSLSRISYYYPWVIWEDDTETEHILYGYNILKSLRLTIPTEGAFPFDPEVDGNIVVWSEGNDIYGYELRTKNKFPISVVSQRKEEPDICGDIVVWKEYGDDPWSTKIVGYDLGSQKRFVVRDTLTEKHDLRICGHYIVWQEYVNSQQKSQRMIMAYSIESGEVMVCSEMDMGSDIDIHMDVSGDTIVWEEYFPTTWSWTVFGFNLKDRRRFSICGGENDMYCPRISGKTVIWIDNVMEKQRSRAGRLLISLGLMKKSSCNLRGKIFRHWPGEGK
jgi:hypothetical protein